MIEHDNESSLWVFLFLYRSIEFKKCTRRGSSIEISSRTTSWSEVMRARKTTSTLSISVWPSATKTVRVSTFRSARAKTWLALPGMPQSAPILATSRAEEMILKRLATCFCTSSGDLCLGRACQDARKTKNIITSSAKRRRWPSMSSASTSRPSSRSSWTTAEDCPSRPTPTIATSSRCSRAAWSATTSSCARQTSSGTRTAYS